MLYEVITGLQTEPGAAVGVLQAEEIVPLVGRQAPKLVVAVTEQPGPLEIHSPEVDSFRAVDVVVPREGIPVTVYVFVTVLSPDVNRNFRDRRDLDARVV